MMKTYEEIRAIRSSAEVVAYAQGWLEAQRAGQVTSDYHMNLLAWTMTDPDVVLAIVLNLIDFVGDDDHTSEMLALGPVDWLIEHTDDSFTPTLQSAVADHQGFATYTKYRSKHDSSHCWSRLRTE